MRVGFAFFLARYGGIVSNTIALKTRGKYSHVEFYLPECFVVEEDTNIKRHLCFSSYEGDQGVRWKHICLDDGRWELMEFEVDQGVETKTLQWCNSQVGKGYDWAGIMGFVNPWRKGGDPGRWFCSEICHRIGVRLGLIKDEASDKISPSELREILRTIPHAP